MLRKVRDGKPIDGDDINPLLEALDINAREVALSTLQKDLITESQAGGNPAIRKTPIRISTIQGSKGLAEDYVFITYFDDQYYLDTDTDKKLIISDQSICKFLVTLTRARKKVFLISSNPKKQPTFLKWISDERIEVVFDVNDR